MSTRPRSASTRRAVGGREGRSLHAEVKNRERMIVIVRPCGC